MKHKIMLAAVAFTALVFTGASTDAAVVVPLTMTFQSGATFTGDITLADDYSYALGVTGTLSGGPYGSDPITWIWADGANFSSGTDNYSTFLMDGASPGGYVPAPYTYYIQLAYNYTAAPVLTFTTGVSVYGTDNYVNYSDPFVSGSFGAVPEPGAWGLMLLGSAVLGARLRRRPVSAAEA